MHDPYVRVRGAREHNLKDVDADIPRDAFVAFTGVSGSGKSSLAFGTIYAEAQRRYFESVFLPGTYSPCPTCGGARCKPEVLEVAYRGASVADVLALTVDAAADFLVDVPAAARGLRTLQDVGLGYLRLGQPATELSGGEAQRIKLAAELQRSRRGHTLYLLDEPTTGLHPADTEVLLRQLHGLVDAGDSVVVVEHDMAVVAGADWVVDLGPGGGDEGGRIVASGPPDEVAAAEGSLTAGYLRAALGR